MTTVTRKTRIREAMWSSEAARRLFSKYGFGPAERCIRMYGQNTLGDVEKRCGVKNLDGLIAELNEAIASEQGITRIASS